MPKTRPAYPPEFREQIVALARADRSVEELASEFEPSGATIRNWIKAAKIAGGVPTGLSDDEPDELRRLRRENRQLRQEKDILSKGEGDRGP